MLHFLGVRSRKNLVANHLPLRVHGNIEHKTVRKGELTIVIFRGPIAWRVRESDEFGGLHQIQRNVVRNGLNGDPRRHQLEHEDEYKNGGHEATGCGKRKRTKNVVEKNFRAIADALPAAGPILRLLSLRRSDFDANSEIGRRKRTRRTGKQNGKLAIALQLFTAVRAGFKMFAHFTALGGTRRALDNIVEIPRQLRSNGGALHGMSFSSGFVSTTCLTKGL